jgi:hypothetical protein
MPNPFDELAAVVASLEERVSALEGWRAEHAAGMIQREGQISQMRQTVDRDRFLAGLRRGRR